MRFPAKGSLTTTDFIEILKDAAESGLTGMIRLENGPIIKVAYLEKGDIAFASSNEKIDRLTEVLKRSGKLTPEQVEDAQTRQKPHVSLGKMLVELGYIGPKDLLWGARAQVEGILHQLLFWSEGNYQILEGSLPREIIHLNLSVAKVIFDGIAKSQNREWILRHIESPEAVYAPSPDFADKNSVMQLPVDSLAREMDGKKTLQEVAEAANTDTFEICKATVALQHLGLVSRVKSEPEQMVLPMPAETTIPDQTNEEEPFDLVPMDSSVEEQEDIVEEEPDLAEGASGQEQPEPFADKQDVTENLSLGEILQIPTVEELQGEPVNFAATQPLQPKPEVQEREPVSLPAPPSEATNVGRPVPEGKVPMETLAESNSRRGKKRAAVFLGIVLAIGLVFFLYLQRQSRNGQSTPSSNTVMTTPLQAEGNAAPGPPETRVTAGETKSVPEPDINTPASLLKRGETAKAAAAWKIEYGAHKSRYTIQLAIACQEKTIKESFELVSESEEFAVVPLKFKGQDCYRLLFGAYPSSAAAQSSLTTLPSVFLQQSSPAAVIPVAKVLQ